MAIIPVFLAIVLIGVMVVGREPLARKEVLNTLRQVGEQVKAFEAAHGRLPGRTELLNFQLTSRYNWANIDYDPLRIVPDSPPDTVLAYLPARHFRLRGDWHGVLLRDYTALWLSPAELQQKLDEREQRYNRHLGQLPLGDNAASP
jgi:hypothetical protein